VSPLLGRPITWLRKHAQRVLYVLAALSLVTAVGTATVGGFRLHHAALLERQALRTQELAGAVAQLQAVSLRLEAQGPARGAARAHALAESTAAFRAVNAHDRHEAARIRAVYLAYLSTSTHAFERAAAGGRIPDAQQRAVDRALGRLQTQLDAEAQRLAEEMRVTNPKTRTALVAAAIAAGLLVALLIWQFEVQRRAGRIDRDNAARSEELSRLREEFVAAVSHELRTPLTSIIGYLDLIVDGDAENLTDEQRGYLAVATRNADRLHELVGDLLLVAEAESGGLSLDLRDVDLDTLADDCVESARPAAGAKEIQLTLATGAAPHIEGDAVKLAQMMDNLVSNAIKFTPAGGRVTVRTALEDGQALFEVTDTGPGISRADQAQLFERFFRTSSAIEKAIRGTGLGLAITKAIVDAHDGTIEVRSTVGLHSTFRVLLPVSQESTVPAPAVAKALR
jgi:signal transduction histidine kinase